VSSSNVFVLSFASRTLGLESASGYKLLLPERAGGIKGDNQEKEKIEKGNGKRIRLDATNGDVGDHSRARRPRDWTEAGAVSLARPGKIPNCGWRGRRVGRPSSGGDRGRRAALLLREHAGLRGRRRAPSTDVSLRRVVRNDCRGSGAMEMSVAQIGETDDGIGSGG